MLSTHPASREPLLEVGGYRVVRTLSTGRHGARLLVHADGHAWVARVLDHECPDEVIDLDVSVSDAALCGPPELRAHVSLVHDVCTTDDGRVALFEEHLAGSRLDALLRAHDGRLGLGEAVTILAPLARAVDEGHQIGLTGLLLATDGVRFRASGAPVLTRRQTARLGPPLPDRFRHREPRYAADRDALERVGRSIAAALPIDERAALIALLERRPTELDRALFELAEPAPVRLERAQANRHDQPAAPASTAQAGTELAPLAVLKSESATLPSWVQRVRNAVVSALESVGLPTSVVRTAAGVVDRVFDAVTGVVRHAATRWHGRENGWGQRVRLRFVIAGLAGAAAVLLAVVVFTQSEAESSTDDAAGAEDSVHLDPDASVSTTGLPETELHPEPGVWPALIGQLVGRWIDCAPIDPEREGGGTGPPAADGASSVADCTAAVVHEGSAAASLIVSNDERHRLLRDWFQRAGEAVVVERMGGAALVDLIVGDTTRASLLVVRSEAGWRIRDVIG